MANTPPLFVNLDPELKRRLRVAAALADRDMSAHVRALLDEHLPDLEDITATSVAS